MASEPNVITLIAHARTWHVVPSWRAGGFVDQITSCDVEVTPDAVRTLSASTVEWSAICPACRRLHEPK
jgi:hypothetical protein